MKYEEALSRLEAIVRKIESGEMDIDTLSDNLKEAQQLIKTCKDRLTATEKDIDKILGDEK